MKKSTPFTRSALHTASGKMPVASFNWIWKWWRGACILLFPTPLSTALASQVDMTATGKTLERVRDCKPLASSSIVTGQWCCHWHKPCRHLSFCTQTQPGLSSSLNQSLTVCPSCPGCDRNSTIFLLWFLENYCQEVTGLPVYHLPFHWHLRERQIIKLLSCVRKNPSAAKRSHCGHSGKSYCLYTSYTPPLALTRILLLN